MTRDDARTDQVETLRLAIYHAFADDGRAPVPDVLAQQLGLPPAEIDADLHELARQRHVVLDPEGRIVMAHPFAAIPLGFAVMGAETLWWGGCAWDSFALPHLLPANDPVLVATRPKSDDVDIVYGHHAHAVRLHLPSPHRPGRRPGNPARPIS